MNMNVSPINSANLDFVPSLEDRLYRPSDNELISDAKSLLKRKSLFSRVFNAKTQDFLIGAAVTGGLRFATRAGVMGAAGALGVSTLPAALIAAGATGVVMGAYRFGKEYRNDLRIENNGGLPARDLFSRHYAKRLASHLMFSTALSTAGGGMSYALVHVYGDQIMDLASRYGVTAKASAAYNYVSGKAGEAFNAVRNSEMGEQAKALASTAMASAKQTGTNLVAQVNAMDLPGKAATMVSDIRNSDAVAKLSASVQSLKQSMTSLFNRAPVDGTKIISSTQGKIQDRIPTHTGPVTPVSAAPVAAAPAPLVAQNVAPLNTATPVPQKDISFDERFSGKVEPSMIKAPAQAPMTVKPTANDFDPSRFAGSQTPVEVQPAPEAAPLVEPKAAPVAPVQQPIAPVQTAAPVQKPEPSIRAFTGKLADDFVAAPQTPASAAQVLSHEPDAPQTFVPAKEFAGKLKDDFLPNNGGVDATAAVAAAPETTAVIAHNAPIAPENVPLPVRRPNFEMLQSVKAELEGTKLSRGTRALLEKAVNGDHQAQKDVAVKILNKHPETALKLLSESASAGNIQAKVDIAYLKFHGLHGVPADQKTALEDMTALAKGSKHARELLGEWTGKPVAVAHAPQNVGAAVKHAVTDGGHHKPRAPKPVADAVEKGLGKLNCVFKTAQDGTPLGAVCKAGKDMIKNFQVGDKFTIPTIK